MIGYELIKCKNNFHWRDYSGYIIPVGPYNNSNNLTIDAIKEILRSRKSLFIRWETEFDKNNKTNWWYLIKDTNLPLENLSGNTRSKIKRGKKIFKFVYLNKDEVINEGYSTYRNSYLRYKTFEKPFDKNTFIKKILDLPRNTEFFGIRKRSNNELVAFSENYVYENKCIYNTIWLDPAYLKNYSSYVLFFEMDKHYLSKHNFNFVSDGVRSLSHETNIQNFLEQKFGYRKAYAKFNLIYNPFFAFLVYLAYPFKKIIELVPFSFFKRINVILRQEKIKRENKKNV